MEIDFGYSYAGGYNKADIKPEVRDVTTIHSQPGNVYL